MTENLIPPGVDHGTSHEEAMTPPDTNQADLHGEALSAAEPEHGEEPPSPAPEPDAFTEPERTANVMDTLASGDGEGAEDEFSLPEEPEVSPTPEPPPPEPVEEKPQKHWYVVKVTSGREDTIKESIERRVKKDRLEDFFGQIVIPVEKYHEVKTNKNGKKVTRTKERKLYPGYLMVEVAYNDRILYLFRETSGVGDFVGTHPGQLDKPPTPMTEPEVARMLGRGKEEAEAPVLAKPNMDVGDRVRVVDGTFNGMEGTVKQILETQAKLQVELTIFGRPVNVELEYYQVESV